MSAQTYIRRPSTVRALQWTGSNVAEMEAFAGSQFDHDPESDVAGLFTSTNSVWRPLHPGDWAVLDVAGGTWHRLSDDDFRAEYKPALTDNL